MVSISPEVGKMEAAIFAHEELRIGLKTIGYTNYCRLLHNK